MDAWVRCGSAYILRESGAAPSPGGFTGPGPDQKKEDELSNCEAAEKRTLTSLLKQIAVRGMETVKLASVIEAKLGVPKPAGDPEKVVPAPKPDSLLGTAEDINDYLYEALTKLERVATSL